MTATMVIPALMASTHVRRIYNFQFSNLKGEIPLIDSPLAALRSKLNSWVYKRL